MIQPDTSFHGKEFVMFYNIENFFMPDDYSSKTGRAQNSGMRGWDKRKFENKLEKANQVFDVFKKEQGKLPLLIGLCEIQGEKVLERIIGLNCFENRYSFVHFESMDERGVDVALLYENTQIEILQSEPISYIFEIEDLDAENYDATRDVLHCEIRYREKNLHVFVCHLPSKRELDVNRPKREYILKNLKSRITELARKGEAVLMMGDFNENPTDTIMRSLLTTPENIPLLRNPFEKLFMNRNFSTFHLKFGLLFDQILTSEHFSNGDFPLQFSEAHVFNHQNISSWDRKFKGRPFRTYAGTRYLGGYSDHFPVFITFSEKIEKR